jgi:ketosteroid isomerase-like protein
MRYIVVMSFIILSIIPIPSAASGEDVFVEIVTPFFDALKAGDVDAVVTYLGGDIKNRVLPLLKGNQDYPSFLRQQYLGAIIEKTEINSEKNGDLLVGVRIRRARIATEHVSLVLRKDENNTWKIVEQVLSPGGA